MNCESLGCRPSNACQIFRYFPKPAGDIQILRVVAKDRRTGSYLDRLRSVPCDRSRDVQHCSSVPILHPRAFAAIRARTSPARVSIVHRPAQGLVFTLPLSRSALLGETGRNPVSGRKRTRRAESVWRNRPRRRTQGAGSRLSCQRSGTWSWSAARGGTKGWSNLIQT